MKKAVGITLAVVGGGVLALIALFVILAIAFSGGEEEAVSEPATATAEASTEEKPKEEVVKPVGMKEKLQVGEVVFTINKRNKVSSIGGEYGVKAKGEFLVLDVSVENKGTQALMVDSSFFKLLANGKTYEADDSAGIYANEDMNFFYEEINPDITLKGKVVFDISPELHKEDLIVQVQTGVFGTETGEINLK